MFEKIDSPFDNWDKYEAWKAIEDGSMTSVIKEKIEYLLNITEKMEL